MACRIIGWREAPTPSGSGSFAFHALLANQHLPL